MAPAGAPRRAASTSRRPRPPASGRPPAALPARAPAARAPAARAPAPGRPRARARAGASGRAASAPSAPPEGKEGGAAGQGPGALLVVGPGVLGGAVGARWARAGESGRRRVVAQTNTPAKHAQLRKGGLEPRLAPAADAAGPEAPERFPNVLFAAPPSGAPPGGYPAAVAAALELWDGRGAFLFTSSASVYAAECDGRPFREDSPVAPNGGDAADKTDRLLMAEDLVRAAGGNVVRLCGLYHSKRGAHNFFAGKAQQGDAIPRWGGYRVNLIHYEDAADLCQAILEVGSASGQGGGSFPHPEPPPSPPSTTLRALTPSPRSPAAGRRRVPGRGVPGVRRGGPHRPGAHDGGHAGLWGARHGLGVHVHRGAGGGGAGGQGPRGLQPDARADGVATEIHLVRRLHDERQGTAGRRFGGPGVSPRTLTDRRRWCRRRGTARRPARIATTP